MIKSTIDYLHASPFAANHNLARGITLIWSCSIDVPALKKRKRDGGREGHVF